MGQGRENAKQFLMDNKDLADEIRQAVLQSKGLLESKKVADTLSPVGELVEASA